MVVLDTAPLPQPHNIASARSPRKIMFLGIWIFTEMPPFASARLLNRLPVHKDGYTILVVRAWRVNPVR